MSQATATLEERVAILEKEIADLKRQMGKRETTRQWLERISGRFKDDPEFDKIVRLGRVFRESERLH